MGEEDFRKTKRHSLCFHRSRLCVRSLFVLFSLYTVFCPLGLPVYAWTPYFLQAAAAKSYISRSKKEANEHRYSHQQHKTVFLPLPSSGENCRRRCRCCCCRGAGGGRRRPLFAAAAAAEVSGKIFTEGGGRYRRTPSHKNPLLLLLLRQGRGLNPIGTEGECVLQRSKVKGKNPSGFKRGMRRRRRRRRRPGMYGAQECNIRQRVCWQSWKVFVQDMSTYGCS